MGHYAVSKKAKLFKLFDAGKRPSDVAEAPVSRRTLYQYYREWRLERKVSGKHTGFAIKKFDRRAQLKAIADQKRKAIEDQRRAAEAQKRIAEIQKRAAEKEALTNLVRDWEALAEGFRKWDESRIETGRVYLPGSGNSAFLKHRQLLRPGINTPLSKEENALLFRRWAELGKAAQNIEDFKILCCEHRISLPRLS